MAMRWEFLAVMLCVGCAASDNPGEATATGGGSTWSGGGGAADGGAGSASGGAGGMSGGMGGGIGGGIAAGGMGGMGSGGMATGGMGSGGMATGGMATGGMGTGGMGDTTPPVVMAMSPLDGATAVDPATPLTVTFSEAMNAATISATTSSTCSGSVQYSADGFVSCVAMAAQPTTADNVTFSLTPAVPLGSATTYALKVTTAAQDQAGNPLATEQTSIVGFAVRYFHSIVIDGNNDFLAEHALPTSTAGGQLYLSHDATHLYVGLAHPDVQIGGSGDKFVYFLFSTDATLASGQPLSSDNKAQFGANGRLMFHWKERIDGPAFSEYSVATMSDWSGDWTGNGKTAFRAAGFLEGSIALSEFGMGNQRIIVTAYTVDYAGDNGNGWIYNMLGAATDGSGATPRPLVSYVDLQLPTSLLPNDASQLVSF